MESIESKLSLDVCFLILKNKPLERIKKSWKRYENYVLENEIKDCEGYQFTKNLYDKYMELKK